MAYKLMNSKYCPFVDAEKREYLCDTDADFATLPSCATGSIAVTPAGTARIVNASGEWVEYVRGSGGGNNDELEAALDNIITLQNSYIGGTV